MVPLAASVLALSALVPATPAAPAASGPEPWQPTTQVAFTVPAGKYCSFAFSYQPTSQDLQQRVLTRYRDGTVRAEEYRGPLVGTFTNLDTGATISRDSSGTAVEQFRPDGTESAYTSYGVVGVGFRATDRYPQGYYELGGVHRVRYAPDGTRSMVIDRGPEENICDTLAG